ncbi:MAG: class I SAM-dependent methyltransferase [Opitutaceae bacterium]|nr:class I SAM-dependent methyltransferase [Opitutaceae bacterium]
MAAQKITAATVCDDFNDPVAVIHYARAAHHLGLWASERTLIERYFTDPTSPLLEAGCGAGRATLGLWDAGYQNLTAFDFATELLDQARSLAAERTAGAIRFVHADATALKKCHLIGDTAYGGALFLFNGLMQIPGRENRRAALRGLHELCRPGAPLLFTTHDREQNQVERALWRLEALRWERGEQDPRLLEFGDRYFEEAGTGRTFMHLPDRTEILADLVASGWTHTYDALRKVVAKESRAVRDFSDECRFWVAHKI